MRLAEKQNKGSMLLTVLIVGFILSMTLTAIASLLVANSKITRQKENQEKAFQIAEAGLNYYRWQLAHDRDDYTGVSEQPYYDQTGSLLGYFTVTVEATGVTGYGQRVTLCHKPGTAAERTIIVSGESMAAHLAHGDYEGECATTVESNTNVITLTSTGWTTDNPNIQRTIKARYGQPSLARYAFITNSNIWFGNTEVISGQVHSNGGIRMDGTCNSLMTSIKETYICGEEHGCADEEKPGIWGAGTDDDLWDFPITEGIDFDAVTVDLDTIKTEADTSGVYLSASGAYGYIIDFDSAGTFNVRKVTKLEDPAWGYDGTDWVYESYSYKNSSNVGTYTIPSNGLIFVEDDAWVEGDVDGRVTLVAARLPDGDYEDANIYIQNDINYTSQDGVNVLGLIAQNDILIPLYSDDELNIDAALLAQKGHIFRLYYDAADYPLYALRSSLTLYGTIISNAVWTFNWVSEAGGPVTSGYETTSTTYDSYLFYSPPPSFPTEDEYEFISWEEVTAE